MTQWDGQERRKKMDELVELNKRLNALEFSQGVIITKLDNLQLSKNTSQADIERILNRHDSTLFGSDGDSDGGITSRVSRVRNLLDEHIVQDRWGFGVVVTLLIFILGILIKKSI